MSNGLSLKPHPPLPKMPFRVVAVYRFCIERSIVMPQTYEPPAIGLSVFPWITCAQTRRAWYEAEQTVLTALKMGMIASASLIANQAGAIPQ